MDEAVHDARDVSEAWLAGIQHVLECKGCVMCQIGDSPKVEKEEIVQEEETLAESVAVRKTWEKP